MKVKESKANARFDDFKRRVKRLIFTRAEREDLERIEKLPENEKKEALKQRRNDSIIAAIVCAVIVLLIILMVNAVYDNKQEVASNNNEKTTVETQTTTTGKKIEVAPEKIDYLYDEINKIDMDIRITHLDEDLSYSTTYINNNIPEGKQLKYTKYYPDEIFTSIFFYGYPRVSYQDLGLDNELEAYAATQLAVYEAMSREGYTSSKGLFSISKVSSKDDEHKEKTEKIKTVATSIVEKAYNETYVDNTSIDIPTDNKSPITTDEYYQRGAFKVIFNLDDKIKAELEQSDLKMGYELVHGDGEMIITDAQGNKLETVGLDQEFYYQTKSKEEPYLGWLKYSVKYQAYMVKLYQVSDDLNAKNYIILSQSEKEITKFSAISIKHDYATADINFFKEKGEVFSGAKYRIYDEAGNLVIDVKGGYIKGDAIALPLGKYYVEQYGSIDGYFVNPNKFEFELKEKNTSVSVNIINDSIY